ncbi:MAG TPA: phenylacetate--CoA ligase family protein [Gemmataceae bacterium]|jgi:phenylacetate-CoA ligase|nr:phenylacetate--CoA ligase family protein [Gemmataceae bacterium]
MDWQRYFTRYLIAPAWAAWEGSPYLRTYRSLKRTQFDPPERMRERQLQALRQIIRHAHETVPYYRHLYDQHAIRPKSMQSLSDIERIPVLTKAVLREKEADLISEPYRNRPLHRKKTSGSTGVPLQIHLDDPAMQFKRACTLRADEWSGWRFGEPVAKLWGNPEYRRLGWRGRLRNALLDRSLYLDTLAMNSSALAAFADEVRRRQPTLLFGHAHSVYLFAQFVRDRSIGGIRPHGIITTAMVLHEWQRNLIEDVFACKVTNRYGCEEVSLIASECEQHNGLHLNTDGLYVEILANGRPAADGEAGAIVITDLVNRAMPIIRYKVGDVAVPSPRHCPCGRGLPLIERLEGRESDYVTTENGELISGISLTENFALHISGIAQMQIIQESRTQFRFRIVRGDDFGPPSLERLQRLVRERFGRRTQYEIEFVDEIPQEPSGKYRFCISRVPVSI